MSYPNVVPDPASVAKMPAVGSQAFVIVLKPISHPALDDIRIEDNLFAIGRTEPPFVSYDAAIVADLSRRHARIFSEFGAVYIADLGSKNGTTVNGIDVRQKPTQLNDGDELCLARALRFRVQLDKRAPAPGRAAKLLSLTLTPEHADLGLQPMVIARFPFLISKADDAFARYKEKFPQQLNYISRRHAHIFLKNGQPFVEDLGSTNGTFVGGKRLDEHAVALHDSDLLAFGGHQLVYHVSLQKEVVTEPTATRLSVVGPRAAPASGDPDKTTFLAAADSFLDIFCVDRAAQQDDELNNEVSAPPAEAAHETSQRGRQHKFAIFLAELKEAFGGDEPRKVNRIFRWGSALAAGLAVLLVGLYLGGSPTRDLKALLARDEFAQAAIAARQSLEKYPDNPELKALGTEALLKANVPNWFDMIKRRDFEHAAATVAAMKELAVHNADAQPLVSELEWIGRLEQFVAGRGSGDVPIRIYADEDKIAALLKEWEQDPQGHQRAFTAISSHVPAFKEGYAEALSHLRKLQSDDSVYLAAIDRLKTSIGTELNRDHPEALEAIFKEYLEKYPRLGGVDSLRQDLRQYLEIENEIRARNLGPLIALLAEVRFVTPPFQEKLRTLAASGRLPSAELVAQHQAVSKAWREGDTKQAFEGLQKMSASPWADAVATESKHKKSIEEQFAELQKVRGTKAYDERLLAFYGVLDPTEDVYFVRATEKDLGLIKEQALKQADELLNRAQARWRQYRENGPIEGGQRLEATISNPFRTQALLLSEAHEAAQQGLRIYTQLKVDLPESWRDVQKEIAAEAESQRNALLDLRNVLEPGLLKAKLVLIGGRRDDERKSP